MKNSIQTIEVQNKSALKDFLRLPAAIYGMGAESHYVLPLNLHTKMMLGSLGEKHKHLLLAYKDDRPVARLAVKVHRHGDEKILHFGFFECMAKHPEAPQALFAHAHSLYPELPMRGPYHFRMEDPYIGSLVKGFDEDPYIFMSYNAKYLDGYLQSAGLRKSVDLFTYKVNVIECPAQIVRISERSRQRTGVQTRWLDPKKLKEEVKTIASIFNEALSDNWGFEPITDDQLDEMYMIFKFFIDPRLVVFLHKDGVDIGCAIMLPNLNHFIKEARGRFSPGLLFNLLFRKKKYNTARAYAMGVRKKYQGSGIVCQIIEALYARALELNIGEVEISWVLENNLPMTAISESMGGVHNKTYRVYEKPPLTV